MRKGLAASTEADERRAKVVLGICLVGLATASQSIDSLPRQPFRSCVVALLEQCRCLVRQRAAARPRADHAGGHI